MISPKFPSAFIYSTVSCARAHTACSRGCPAYVPAPSGMCRIASSCRWLCAKCSARVTLSPSYRRCQMRRSLNTTSSGCSLHFLCWAGWAWLLSSAWEMPYASPFSVGIAHRMYKILVQTKWGRVQCHKLVSVTWHFWKLEACVIKF